MCLGKNARKNARAGLNQYQFNGIERNEDLGLNWDMAAFRGYDAAIGRWTQVDPMAEAAFSWTPYRFGFNNPVYYFDPDGLFESRGEARRYRREHGIRGGINKVKDAEGNISYSIDDRNSGSSVTNIEGLGIVESNIMITASRTTGQISQMGMGSGIDWDKEVGFGESLIPIWGSMRMAVRDFRNGDYGWAVFNSAMAISDVFLAKSLITGAGRLAASTLWKTGSHSWGATRSWLGRRGLADKGQEVHHWLFHRNGGIGKRVPESVKNQPWNLVNMPNNPAIHDAIHGGGPLRNRRLWYLFKYSPDYVKGSFGGWGRYLEYKYRDKND